VVCEKTAGVDGAVNPAVGTVEPRITRASYRYHAGNIVDPSELTLPIITYESAEAVKAVVTVMDPEPPPLTDMYNVLVAPV